ncbi:MAG: flagellar hook-associated 2 domain protein [Anaerocolumna sp.]|jgi:flagellar hook-associated protein 2|nr:flagellar hook-associated 2 domain protein [Anaerocolumna sp.]
MAVRLTGMISGMDTESIIKELMDAQKLKNKRVEDKQTKLTWTQEKWKELNTKLYKLYTEDLSKMRLQGNYGTKKVTSSNSNLVEATGSTSASAGEHSISVTKLASSQYVTGGKLASTVTSSTTLQSLGMTSSTGNSTVIKIANGDKTKNLIVTDKTTINDFVTACKDVGLNANYDTTQQRLFVSSKTSGETNKFTITTGEMSNTGADALKSIQSLVNYSGLSTSGQATVNTAIKNLEGKTIDDTLFDSVMNETSSSLVVGSNDTEKTIISSLRVLRDSAIKKAETSAKAAAVEQVVVTKVKPSLIDKYGSEDNMILEDLKKTYSEQVEKGTLVVPDGSTKEDFIDAKAQDTLSNLTAADKTNYVNNLVSKEYKSTEPYLNPDGTEKTVDGKVVTKAAEYQNQVTSIYNANVGTFKTNAFTALNTQLDTYLANNGVTNTATSTNLSKIGLAEINGVAHTASTETDYTVVAASNAEFTLDGAALTSTSNQITVNGLTITAKGVTAPGEKLSLSVNNNTQATYDMVKNFIKSYNDILKEMNTLYYADSSRGYDPLTDEEKEAMTDDQVEKWESKIKDSLLRRDSSLGSLLSSMKTAMSSTVEVNGKKYSLSNYGIQTSTDYTEKGLLHIYGNQDDAVYSGKQDKLMKALEEDPETVISILSGISKNLYDTMGDKMKAIPNVRSALTFYNDKLMVNQQKDLKSKISTLESKLTEMENKYYKQFSAMESAMAKLQSQSSALSGLLGTA